MESVPYKTVLKASPTVWLILFLTISLDTVVQMTWKSAVLKAPELAGFKETICTLTVQPMFYLLLILLVVQFTCWIFLLAKTDLSYAYPITAISFISVAFCSDIFFNEKVGIIRMAGIAMALIGVWFISNTNHRTKAVDLLEPDSAMYQPLEVGL